MKNDEAIKIFVNYLATGNIPRPYELREASKAAITTISSYEQMLKDAFVDNVDDGRIELEGDPLPCLNPIILLPYPQFKPEDKVRIVVLKEEEE